MSAQSQPRLTPEQYLESERAAEFRTNTTTDKYMRWPAARTSMLRLSGGLVREFGNALKKRPCAVVPSDLRLRVSPDGLYTYPDVVVICGDPASPTISTTRS